MKRTTARYLNACVRAYDISGSMYGPLDPVAAYPFVFDKEVLSHAVAPDLSRAVCITANSMVCIDQGGTLLWRYELDPRSSSLSLYNPACVFSLDGTSVWVYRPDAMAGRGPDMLVVLSAVTGEVVASVELDTVGQGAWFVLHPDTRHVLFQVGEGQDGAKLFRATISSDGINLHPYEWTDRWLVDLSPDGRWLMTSDLDVMIHSFPSGEVVLRLPLEAFGYDEEEEEEDEEACIKACGGFLSPDIAIVVVAGETGEEEWDHYHKIDLRIGAPVGRLETHARHIYDFEPLGDGTWIVSDPDGRPVRYRL